MRIVIQRVSRASVTIADHVKSKIGKGYLILLGIEAADTTDDIDWLVKKIIGLRVFDDENGVMNLSIMDTGGDIIVVSQFTLMASYKKGNRPSWIRAAKHDISIPFDIIELDGHPFVAAHYDEVHAKLTELFSLVSVTENDGRKLKMTKSISFCAVMISCKFALREKRKWMRLSIFPKESIKIP